MERSIQKTKSRSMRVLLLNPPWIKGFNRFSRWSSRSVSETLSEPLYLAYATAVLERDTNADVKLIDAFALGWKLSELKRNLKKINPDLVVIESTTPSFEDDMKTVKIIKNNTNAKIMLVGTHGSVFPKETLRNNPIDIVAIGEYDYTVRDVVKNFNNLRRVKGIAFKKNGKIIKTSPRPLIENLDSLPFPARHHLDMSKYRESNITKKIFARMISSRGCTGRCIFCVFNFVYNNLRWRGRSAKNVVDEMEHLINEYGIEYIYIDDDTFTIDKKRVHDICKLIIKRGINKKLSWGSLSRIDTVNEKMLKTMVEAGCDLLVYGVESGDQNVLNNMKKGITLEQIRRVFKWTKKAGIRIHATFMFGSPGETKETIRKTIEFAKELNPDTAQFPICMPYPGTEFYEIAKKNNWLKFNKWSDFYSATDRAVIETPQLSRKDLEKAVKMAYKEFYMRPRFILKKLFSINSFSQFKETIKGGFALLKSLR
ncbi:MAG: B12-binding domain-containing radical SAM protein [Candidatus Aenigmatarchaeota archaeon]